MKKYDQTTKQKLIQEWLASGERKSDFAARHHINRYTFYCWVRKRTGKPTEDNSKGFQQITIEGKESRLSSQSPAAVIHYPSGAILELYPPLNIEFVKSLIK